MSLDVAAIEGRYVPVELTVLLGLRLQRLQGLLPNALLCPAVEPGGAGSPGAIAAGDVAPGCAGSQHPKDAVDNGAMVFISVAFFARSLGWQQGVELLPLLVR